MGFFLFTGSISSIEKLGNLFSNILKNPLSTYLAGLISSQVISNVPASLLLSNFTQNATELLASVNVAGLGTLIASLASVISYKLYKNFVTENPDFNISKGGYFSTITLWNVILLIILGIFVFFLL